MYHANNSPMPCTNSAVLPCSLSGCNTLATTTSFSQHSQQIHYLCPWSCSVIVHYCLGLLQYVVHAIGWLQVSLHLTSCHPWATCREWKNLIAKGIFSSSGPSWAVQFMLMIQDSLSFIERRFLARGTRTISLTCIILHTWENKHGVSHSKHLPWSQVLPFSSSLGHCRNRGHTTPWCLLHLVCPVGRHFSDLSEDAGTTEVPISFY